MAFPAEAAHSTSELEELSPRLLLASKPGEKIDGRQASNERSEWESVFSGPGGSAVVDGTVDIIPIRSPIDHTKMDGAQGQSTVSIEPEVFRGRAQVSAAGRTSRTGKVGEVSPALSTVRGFYPGDSAAEESDQGAQSPMMRSPMPKPPLLAGASPARRPASPAVSNLKLQFDALNIGSRAGSRSTSLAPSKAGSETPGSEMSTLSDPEAEDDVVSYEVPLDQDFVTTCLEAEANDRAGSLSTLCPDQLASSRVSRKMAADDFSTLKCLGKGSYGTVHLVKQRATGRLYAQKQFRKASLTVHKKLVEQTKTERCILESVNRHPFIVNLYYAFQDREKLYLILEYAQGGELFHHLAVEKFFSEDVAAFYMAEMVLALDHLHHVVGVIYRDLKPENCLLDSEGHLLLTDFGLSKVAVEDAKSPGSSRCNSTGIGTIDYMAPEVIRGSEVSAIGPGYGKQCDWWSLGALGCDLLTGSPPFKGNNYTKIQQNVMRQKLHLPFFLSPDAKDLLTRLLRKEPGKRLGAKGRADVGVMKQHRFFRKLDWAKLAGRAVRPPIRPLITDPEAAENFSSDFTSLAVSPSVHRHSRGGSVADPFGGFSYVASSSLLESGYQTSGPAV